MIQQRIQGESGDVPGKKLQVLLLHSLDQSSDNSPDRVPELEPVPDDDEPDRAASLRAPMPDLPDSDFELSDDEREAQMPDLQPDSDSDFSDDERDRAAPARHAQGKHAHPTSLPGLEHGEATSDDKAARVAPVLEATSSGELREAAEVIDLTGDAGWFWGTQ